jgi:transposase InsO family protein
VVRRAGDRDRLHREGATAAELLRVERFNGTTRNKLLNGEDFDTLLEARVMIEAWVVEYNTKRPHRGLGMMTPLAFAEAHNQVGQ